MKTELLHSLEKDHEDAFIPRPPSPMIRAQSLRHFRLDSDEDGTAWITFDMEGAAANVWNETTLHEFDLCLEAVSRDSTLKTLVIQSAKEHIFIAGADLKAVRHAPVRQLETMIGLGQKVFNRLAALPLHKIALIHGACVGGGLELALACDTRIVSDSDRTRLGLPETQIGLVPAWGGSTRLPRLIGLPAALQFIVTGKLLKPSAAKRAGLADFVVPRERFEDFVHHRIALGAPKRRLSLMGRVSLLPGARHFIASQVKKAVLTKTRGLYQAPLRAVEVAMRAAVAPLPKAMEIERHAIQDLALTPATGHLIDLFFRKEEADKKPWPRGVALPVHHAAVVGAGVMGAGIAHWLASRGVRVLMQDISTDALARGMERVHGLLKEGVKRRAVSRAQMRDALDRLSAEHTRVPLTHEQIIIEAATEDMALKKKIFADLAARCGPDTVLATNTSALSVTELAGTLPHPERVIGLHFFNPVHRMPLVEIITTPHTSDDVIATATAFVQKLGKTPVVVRDSPGFIVNRVLMPYLMEAVRLYESGIPAETIDEAMLEFGMPMGPLRLLDEIGLDVAAHVGRTLVAAFPDRLAASDLLDRMAGAGKLGKKSGEGFYKYGAKAKRKTVKHDASELEHVQHRLALLLANEAARCAREKLTQTPESIDLAMILGTGYPPFRGGPLTWLRELGAENAKLELQMLTASTPQPNAFEPA